MSSVVENEKSESVEMVGPEIPKPKRRKKLLNEKYYLEGLPSAQSYEKSYMHRGIINFVGAATNDFLITTSEDGHLKFWKKTTDSIEFIKHFRCHIGNIEQTALSYDGTMVATISNDKTMKIFEVVNFDMITMRKLDFEPFACGWIYSRNDPEQIIAVSEKNSSKIHVFDAKDSSRPSITVNRHFAQVNLIKFNGIRDIVVSTDTRGLIEYWGNHKPDFTFPEGRVGFSANRKVDTDLYSMLEFNCHALDLAISPNGDQMAAICSDRRIRIFDFMSAKIIKSIDEALSLFVDLQQQKAVLANMEFGRRMAIEKELEKSAYYRNYNIVFDNSGNYVIYATMLGIKIVNLVSNAVSALLGKNENCRFLHLALFQGIPRGNKISSVVTPDMMANASTYLSVRPDPTLFCTGFKKNRVFLFTRREPTDDCGELDRDVFNEKPTKEELNNATAESEPFKISSVAIIHSSYGDIHIKLFGKEAPRTVENFCVHARNGYYNAHLFHRVIKCFMVQTGDPDGLGTGGESIWGGTFEDEFHPSLTHDKPFTVSMANRGPDTNGSQFFITTVPTPWLDNKHTIFGRVFKGMEVVQSISLAKTDGEMDKPVEEIMIISITLKK